MASFFKKHKFDIIIIGFLCIVALSVFLFFELTKTKGNYVSVVVDKKDIATYSLDKDGEYKIGNEENYNLLVISEGSAYVKEATCPDKLCVNQGKAEFNNDQLICLPNKTIITVVSDKNAQTDF